MSIISNFEEVDKAQDLLREKKVARLNVDNDIIQDHFIVSGSKDRKYLVILPDFCTCTHFQVNCIRTIGKICKHILACKMNSTNVPKITMKDWDKLLINY